MSEEKELAKTQEGAYPYNPRDRRKAMESELNLLLKKHGGILTPEDVLAQAEDPTSALHGYFTWNEQDAAHKWRLIEARQLITSIRMLQEGDTGKTRSLVSLNVDRYNHQGGGYRSLNDVMADPNLRQHLLETALSELNAIERKYRHIQELDTIWGDLGTIRGEIADGKSKKD